MGIEHTSVPRWQADAPPFDPRARSATVLALCADAEPVAAAWAAAGGAAGVPVSSCTGDLEQALRHLDADMAGAVVGWRLLVAGPEAEVLRVRARATELGAVGSEVLAHVTGVPSRRVLCVHCDAVTETDEPVGGTVACAGCGHDLHLYHHVSRRLGAYLGFLTDAEERDPAGAVLETR
jgi:hypothetical protein